LQKNLNIIAKGATFMLAGYVISKLLAYVYRVIIARYLGPSDFGILSIGLAVQGIIIVLAALGLYQGVLHFIAVYESTGDGGTKKIRGTILGSLRLQAIVSLPFAAALFLASDHIANGFTVPFLGIFVGYKIPQLGIILKILAFSIPLEVLTSNLMIITQSFRKVEYRVLLRSIVENIVKIALTGSLLLLGFGLFGASIALVLSCLIAFLAGLYIVQKKVYKLFAGGKEAIAAYNMRELFSYSWPLFAIGFFGVLMRVIDTLMLGYMSTTYNTGIYNVAAPTANMLTIAENAFGTLFLPVVTGLYAVKNMHELKRTYKTVTRWIFAAIFPATLFTVLFSGEILGIMFGEVYTEGAGALAILSIGYFLVSFCGPVRNMMESISKTRLILYNTLAAAFINIALNAIMIPIMGMNGAALATTISLFIWNVLAWIEVYYYLRVHPYSKAYLNPTIASCAAIAVFFVIKQFLPPLQSLRFPLDMAALIILGAAFVGFYALLFIVFRGLQPEDLAVLSAVEKRLGFKANFARNFIKRFSG